MTQAADAPSPELFLQSVSAYQRTEALRAAIIVGQKLTEKPVPLISHRVTKAGVEDLAKEAGPVKPKRGGAS